MNRVDIQSSLLVRIIQHVSAYQERYLAALVVLALGFVSTGQYNAHGLDLASWDMLLVTGLAVFALGLRMVERVPHRFELALNRMVDRGALELTNAGAEGLRDSLQRTTARWCFGLALLSAVAMLVVFIAAFYQGYNVSLGNVVLTVFEVAGAYIAGFYVGRMAAYGQFGSALRKRRITLILVPDHADGAGGLKPIGDFYLFQAKVAAIPALFVGLWALLISLSPWYDVRYAYWREPYLGLLLVTLTFVFLALIVPMWSLHRLMEKERGELLKEADSLSSKIVEIETRLKARLGKKEYDALEDQALKERLQERYRVIERTPTWPLDLRPRIRFFSTVALDLLALVSGLITIVGSLSKNV